MYELGVVYRNIHRTDAATADGLARYGSATVHEAMGRVGLMKPFMRPIYAVCAGVGHRGHRAAASGRQLDDARGGRTDPPGRHRGGRDHRRMHRRLLRRPAGHQLHGARCEGPGDRRRRARREDADRDGLPGVEQGHQQQGHDQGHAGLGEHPCGVAPGALVTPGDVGRGRRRRRGLRAARDGGLPRWTPRPSARPTKAPSARSWPPACWAWTCTACASRWPRPGCATSIDDEDRADRLRRGRPHPGGGPACAGHRCHRL